MKSDEDISKNSESMKEHLSHEYDRDSKKKANEASSVESGIRLGASASASVKESVDNIGSLDVAPEPSPQVSATKKQAKLSDFIKNGNGNAKILPSPVKNLVG